MLIEKACHGEDTYILIELNTRVNCDGLLRYRELSMIEYEMIATVAIKRIMQNLRFPIQNYTTYFSPEAMCWVGRKCEKYTVAIRVGNRPTEEDVDRCRQYTFIDGKGGETYRPMTKRTSNASVIWFCSNI